MGKFGTKSAFSGGGDFSKYLAPEDIYTGTIAVVADRGEIDTSFGRKHKITILVVLNAKNEDGDFYTLRQDYTYSLHEKANLYGLVCKAMGAKKITEEDLDGLDLDDILIGKTFDVDVVHNESGDRTFANIEAFMKPRGTAPDLSDWELPEFFANESNFEAVSWIGEPEFQQADEMEPEEVAEKAEAAEAEDEEETPAPRTRRRRSRG